MAVEKPLAQGHDRAWGVYFETWIMILLTLFWAQTQTGLLQTVILQVTVVAGAMALLFNLNPAVKLDGYFVMTDYFRAPNRAAREGAAARTIAARMLGADLPKPRTHETAYWIISYVYRWTIFAGIFWLIYQFDARLAPVALGVVVMTLLVRPLVNTLRFARKSGVRFAKAATTVAVLDTASPIIAAEAGRQTSSGIGISFGSSASKIGNTPDFLDDWAFGFDQDFT